MSPAMRRDVIIAGVIAIVEVLGAALAGTHQDTHREFGIGAALLIIGGAAGLVWRTTRPVMALLVAYVAALTYALLGYPQGPIYFALIVALVTVIVAGHRVAGWVMLTVGWASFTWLPSLVGVTDAPSWGAVLGLASWLLVLGTTSEIIRVRHERSVALRRVREEETELHEREEQLRIARELHDVVAHDLSLINVQAGTALHLIDERPELAQEALAAIKVASKDALDELRGLVDMLRAGPERAPRRPTPTLSDVGDLVERSRSAGIPVELRVHGTRRALPRAVETAAYRVTQEALTNVARHAGPSRATVDVQYADDVLVVQIDDDGCGSPPGATSPGKGLVGMRERVQALGGQLNVGNRRDHGFRVVARIPVGTS